MKDDDSFFGLFKESSESARDFDFKPSGWDKLSSRLNEDRAKKRRRLLLILPWILLPGMLVFNAMLFHEQKEANENLSHLQQELINSKQIKTDTIVIEKHIYSHDTVYVYVTNYPITYSGVNNQSQVKHITKTIADKTNDAIISSDTNSSQTMHIDKHERGINSGTFSVDTSNNSSVRNVNTVDNSNDNKGDLNENAIPADTDSTFAKKNFQNSNDSNAEKQQVDSLNESLIAKSDSLNKEKISLRERLNNIKFEYGIQAAGIFPKDIESVSQRGLDGGIGFNALLSKRVNVFTDINYGLLRVHTTKMNQVPWVPILPTPDSTYSLDNALTFISTLKFSVGFRYNIPIYKKTNLLFDLGYGAHYIFPYKVVYEFKNKNPDNDLVVETKPNHTGFVTNDFLFGLGLGYNLNDKYKLYLLSHYRINRQATPYKLPDYFGISLGLFY